MDPTEPANSPPATTPRAWLSWLVILVSVAGILGTDRLIGERESGTGEEMTLIILAAQAKILVGADRFVPNVATAELRSLDTMATTPATSRALAALNATLASEDRNGTRHALELLERHRFLLEDEEERTLHDDVRSAILAEQPLSAQQAARIEDGLGWFGELLLSRDLPAADPARTRILRQAMAAVLAAAGLLLGAVVGVLAGTVLLITGILMTASGRMKLRLGRTGDNWALYLRAFAIYLGLAFVLTTGPAAVGLVHPAAGLAGMVAASVAGLGYAVFRAPRTSTSLEELGLHRGRGFLVEIGCGLLGYVAILPILAAGFLVTLGLIMMVEVLLPPTPGEPPRVAGHPVALWLAHGGIWLRLAIIGLACVFAPLFEESMFRGSLQRGLRHRLGRFPAALIVGLLFAAIHPQGPLLIPALLGLALGFSLLREWRDSLIAPMTAHAVHNGILVGFMWILF